MNSTTTQTLPIASIRRDARAQLRERINDAVAAEYAEALEDGVQLPPVTVYHDGVDHWLADGWHRLTAMDLVGWLEVQAEVRPGGIRDAILHAAGANAQHGIRRTNADKRRAVLAVLADPDWAARSDRWIAERCAVSADLVGQLRTEAGSTVGNDSGRRVGRDGREINTENIGKRHADSQAGPDQLDASIASEVSVLGEALADHREDLLAELEEIQAEADSAAEAKKDRLAVHYSSKSAEHYTPAEVLDAVGKVLGEIDLDPCSNSASAPNVPAKLHYTAEDDGLSKEWHGRVFMNPPYGREVAKWIEHLVAEHQAGRVTEAIVLVAARVDTAWFRQLTASAPIWCAVHGRLTFVGNDNNAQFPSAIVYLGKKPRRFAEVFAELGTLWREVQIEELPAEAAVVPAAGPEMLAESPAPALAETTVAAPAEVPVLTGADLAQWLKATGRSQREAAAVLGVVQSTVSMWAHRPDRQLPPALAEALAKHLNTAN